MACSPWFVQFASYETWDYTPKDGIDHGGLDPTTSMVNQENVPWAFLQADLMETFSQLRVLLLDDLTLDQVGKNNNLANTPSHNAKCTK